MASAAASGAAVEEALGLAVAMVVCRSGERTTSPGYGE